MGHELTELVLAAPHRLIADMKPGRVLARRACLFQRSRLHEDIAADDGTSRQAIPPSPSRSAARRPTRMLQVRQTVGLLLYNIVYIWLPDTAALKRVLARCPLQHAHYWAAFPNRATQLPVSLAMTPSQRETNWDHSVDGANACCGFDKTNRRNCRAAAR